MKINKIYLTFLSLLFTFSIQSLTIYEENGYQELISKYQDAMSNAKKYFREDKNVIKEYVNAKKILITIAINAMQDIIRNAPLRSFLSHYGFLSADLVQLSPENEKDQQRAVTNLVKNIKEKVDNIKKNLETLR